MKVLLVGNCLLEKPNEILNARGYDSHFTYIANPVTLLHSKRIPDGLAEAIAQLDIEDRLEHRSLASQFEGISSETSYDIVFINYYHEQRPLLRHKKEKYLLHLNFQAIQSFDPPRAWNWITQHFDIVDILPEKYLERFVRLIFKIRKHFPKASIVLINKFHPAKAVGPIAEWFNTEGRPFDPPFLEKMASWTKLLSEKDQRIFFFTPKIS